MRGIRRRRDDPHRAPGRRVPGGVRGLCRPSFLGLDVGHGGRDGRLPGHGGHDERLSGEQSEGGGRGRRARRCRARRSACCRRARRPGCCRCRLPPTRLPPIRSPPIRPPATRRVGPALGAGPASARSGVGDRHRDGRRLGSAVSRRPCRIAGRRGRGKRRSARGGGSRPPRGALRSAHRRSACHRVAGAAAAGSGQRRADVRCSARHGSSPRTMPSTISWGCSSWARSSVCPQAQQELRLAAALNPLDVQVRLALQSAAPAVSRPGRRGPRRPLW